MKFSRATLAIIMLRDNPTIQIKTSFSSDFSVDTTGIIYKQSSTIANQMTEDINGDGIGEDVYYYSGNTTKNWVKFGKYGHDFIKYRGYFSDTSNSFREYNSLTECQNASSYDVNCTAYKYASVGDDIYWRILRINEDGSIRLLYAGTSPDTTQGYIAESAFNEIDNDPMYAGYMYGTTGSLINNRKNIYSSTLKINLDTWYENNLLTNYDKYISKTAIYCNDRSVIDGQYSIANSFDFGVESRFKTSKTLVCGGDGNGGFIETKQSVADKFSVSTSSGGNGLLKYPIATITHDEIDYSGSLACVNSENADNTILYVNKDDENVYSEPLTMTPSMYITDEDGNYTDLYKFNCESYYSSTTVAGQSVVKPVISLKSCVKHSSGDGTSSNPYEVTIDDTCASAEN